MMWFNRLALPCLLLLSACGVSLTGRGEGLPIAEVVLEDGTTLTIEEDGTISVDALDAIRDGDRFDDAIVVITIDEDDAPVDGGSFSFDRDGTNASLTITPLADANGTATVTITLREDGEDELSFSFVVNVTPVNDAPTIAAIDDRSLDNTVTIQQPVTVGDVETAVDTLEVTVAIEDDSLATVTLSGTGAERSLEIVPASSADGATTITLTVSDGELMSTESFELTLVDGNELPTAGTIAAITTDEDTDSAAVAFAVSDPDGDDCNIVLSASSSDTSVVADAGVTFDQTDCANPTVVVSPVDDASGTATITVTVADELSASVTTTVDVTVTAVNDAPMLGTLSAITTAEDTASSASAFTLADVDSDVCAVTLSVTGVTGDPIADLGDFAFDQTDCANPTVVVTPNDDANGTATFTIQAQDAEGASTTAMLMVTVTAVNDPPTIGAIAAQTTDEDNDTSAAAFSVGDIDGDVCGITLSITASTVADVADATGVTFDQTNCAMPTIVISPKDDANGTTTLTVRATDDGGASVDTTVMLTVNPVDDPPTITVSIADTVVVADSSTSALAFSINDIDTALSSLTLSGASTNTTLLPEPGAYAFGGTAMSRTVTITPATGQRGTSVVTLSVSDGTTTVAATGTFTLRVNQAPVAVNDTFSGAAGTTGNQEKAFTASLLGNDTDDLSTSALTATVQTGLATSEGGEVDIAANGTFTYRPPAGFLGSDTFTYTVSDNDAVEPLTDTGTVTIQVGMPMIWFVDNTAAAGGDGRSHAPFNTLISINTVSPATGDDTARLAYGDGTSANQNAGVELPTGMNLEGVSSPGGLPPVITNTAGDAVLMANGSQVRNLEIRAPLGAGINAANRSGALVIEDVDIVDAGGTGINVQDSVAGGSVSLEDVNVDSLSGIGIRLFNAGAVRAVGTNTINTDAGTGLFLQNVSPDAGEGFTIDSLTVNGAGQDAINLDILVGGEVELSNIQASTTTGRCLRLVNATTTLVRVLGTTNRCTSTTGRAVDILNADIDMTFEALNADGGTEGISIDNATGAFRVVGTGTTGSGGTIANTSVAAAYLNNAGAVQLGPMRITDSTGVGIRASNITSLTLDGTSIEKTGNGAGPDHAVTLSDITGALAFSDINIATGTEDGILFSQSSGLLTSFAINDSSISGVAGTGISISTNAAGFADGLVFDNVDIENVGAGILAAASATSQIDLTLRNSSVSDATLFGALVSLAGNAGTASTIDFDFDNNTWLRTNEYGVRVRSNTNSNGVVRGYVTRNDFGVAGVTDSAAFTPIAVDLRSALTATLDISDNRVFEYALAASNFGNGILVSVDDSFSPGSATVDVTVAGNSVTSTFAIGEAIALYSTGAPSFCNDVRNNALDATAALDEALVFADNASTIQLAGYAGSALTTLTGNGNTASGPFTVAELGTVTGGTCATLP